MVRYGLVINLSRCIGCHACVVGCKNWHGLPAGGPGRIRILDFTLGTDLDINRWILPLPCMQCEYPPCLAVCRFSACVKGEDGILKIDSKRCVGCELCVLACPYGVIAMRTDTHKADKCDFCCDRLAHGQNPLCVDACPGEALIFGDLDDPKSAIRRRMDHADARPILKRHRTKPRVFYTGLQMFLGFPDAVKILEDEIRGHASSG